MSVHFAGSSTRRRTAEDEGVSATMATWSECPASGFVVRATSALRKAGKSKQESKSAFYDVVGVDLVKSETEKLINVAERVKLMPPRECDDLEAIKKSGLPRLFIVNYYVPMKDPPFFGSHPKDDHGVHVVLYFAVKPDTVQEALKPDCGGNAALKLLKRYAETWDTDPDAARRFKSIQFAENIAEMGTAVKMASRYNGKPLIVYKTGNRHRGANGDYFEIGVVMERWKLFGRKLIKAYINKSGNVVLRFGFTIQGEKPDELPEQILGCCVVHNPDLYKFATVLQ